MPRIIFFGFLIIMMFSAGCQQKKPSQELLIEYNNHIVSLHNQVIDLLDEYYDDQQQYFDGENLDLLYQKVQSDLSILLTQTTEIPPFYRDDTLKQGLIAYMEGIGEALEMFEKPVVHYLTNFTGEVYTLAKEYESKITPYGIQMLQRIDDLDQTFIAIQDDFALRHRYLLE